MQTQTHLVQERLRRLRCGSSDVDEVERRLTWETVPAIGAYSVVQKTLTGVSRWPRTTAHIVKRAARTLDRHDALLDEVLRCARDVRSRKRHELWDALDPKHAAANAFDLLGRSFVSALLVQRQ